MVQIVEKFHIRLKKAMEIRGMRQADLIKKTGIGSSAISQYASGKVEPLSDKICILAEALNVNPSWLSGFDVEMEKVPTLDLEFINTDELMEIAKNKRIMAYATKLMKLSTFQQEMIFNNIDMFEQNNKGE